MQLSLSPAGLGAMLLNQPLASTTESPRSGAPTSRCGKTTPANAAPTRPALPGSGTDCGISENETAPLPPRVAPSVTNFSVAASNPGAKKDIRTNAAVHNFVVTHLSCR